MQFLEFPGHSHKVGAVVAPYHGWLAPPHDTAMNAAVVRSATNSMWTAFTAKHTKNATYDLDIIGLCTGPDLVRMGPAKSTPTLSEIGLGFMQSAGNCHRICGFGLATVRLQIMQL